MTKSIRSILLKILGAAFMLCACFCFLSPVIVRADDVVLSAPISDNIFSFDSETPISLEVSATNGITDWSTGKPSLQFRFRLNNLNYENLANHVPHAHPWFSNSPSPNVFVYEFTLHRDNRDGTVNNNFRTLNPQNSILVVLYPDSDKNFYGYIAEKTYYTDNKIDFEGTHFLSGQTITANTSGYDTDYDDIATDGDYYNWDGVRRYFGQGYVIKERFQLNYNNLDFYPDNGLVLDIDTELDSPFQYYYIKMRYCYNISYDSMSNTETKAYGELDSPTRSVAKVLLDMQEQGVDFTQKFGGWAEYAEEIINTELTEHVRIKFLKEIPGTPYATHVYTYIDVPVLQEKITISDVESALGFSIGKCLDSNTVSFRKAHDSDGDYYEAYYLKNVWLRSMTVDGNYLDYFLDINESFAEFYNPFVLSGALSQDAFEWIYSQKVLNKYPALHDYDTSEIYGYFGMVIIPKSYSLNSVLKDMFDIKTSQIGIISNFSYEGSLSDSAYNSLMSDYGYNWLAKAWSKVGNFLLGEEKDATFYVIYSEPGTESGLVGEGGQENPDDGSIIKEKVADPVMQILGDAWNGITGVLGGIAGNFKTILYIALAVVLGIVGFKVYNGIKGNNRSKRK